MIHLFAIEQIEQLKKQLAQSSHICLVSHVNPDGDAIGSLLAFGQFLQALGKQVSCIVPNKFPAFLNYLSGSATILRYSEEPDQVKNCLQKAELIFCLDFNALTRLDELGQFISQLKVPLILIDHHLDPPNTYELSFSETASSSTCELVYRLIVACGGADLISRSIAEALYTGILTDTGSFSHNSNNPELYRIIAHLLEQGIRKDHIHQALFCNFSVSRMQLMGYTLERKMVVLPEFRAAYMALSKAELDQFNFEPGDTEGFVNLMLNINDIVLAGFFVESNSGMIKISLRSLGDFSVNQFSRDHFSGGGHKNAAGGKSFLTLDETVRKFENLLPQYAQDLQNI